MTRHLQVLPIARVPSAVAFRADRFVEPCESQPLHCAWVQDADGRLVRSWRKEEPRVQAMPQRWRA